MLSGGCASVGITSALSSITTMNMINAAVQANTSPFKPPTGYRALVCILLSGGNDSFNMLVPRGDTEHAEYASVRGDMTLAKTDILPIYPTNITGKEFGVHPNLPYIQQLFNSGKAAFVANTGALVEPTTKLSYNNQSVLLPEGIGSHADFANHWQTGIPQDRDALTGWGGRMADILTASNPPSNISMNLSLDEINLYQKGSDVLPFVIDSRRDGAVQLNGTTSNSFYQTLKRQTLDNMMDATYQNVLETAYSGKVKDAIGTSLEFNSLIAQGTPLTTVFNEDNPVARRLKTVAKTIAAKTAFGTTYQSFFLQSSGWDTHENGLQEHGARMNQLNQAIEQFHQALIELGEENNVAIFTISDFGRKLISNGDGADHGWGGNALVISGALNGQKIYGTYPDLYEDNPLDIGSGRLIPTTSADEYLAEMALWFGASTSDIDQIFPNIKNFWDPASGGTPLGMML